MANAANQVTLSSGQILFADPTKSWGPNNFPNLPSTALSITAAGTIASRNISTLSFSNVIQYQSYENPSLRSNLKKSLIINSAGQVNYDDPRMSLVSTSLSAYNSGLRNFSSSNIGGPGIESDETVTNAVAKIDGWIANSLLKQPPAVNITQIESNSIYGGVRWNNFPVYKTLQFSIPYTSGIVLLLGDPVSNNFLTLELSNQIWFPDRLFIDGLNSDFNPIVRVRVFNSCFNTNASIVCSKATLTTQCVQIIGEGGIYTLPPTGKVFSIENSVDGDTYTTVNLYLPQVPSGTDIPIRIMYINNTQESDNGVNIAQTSTTITTFGGPSPVSLITQTASTISSFTFQVTPPLFSDAVAQVSSCFLSTYTVNYNARQFNSAHASERGYRYGLVTPNITSPYLSSYVNSTFTYNTIVQPGIQNITITGSGGNKVLPGLQWSTSIFAINAANKIGSTISGPNPTLSAFPTNNAPNISSINIQFTSPWAVNNTSNFLGNLTYNGGWTITSPVTQNVVFISTTQNTNWELRNKVLFNDKTFPGSRSTIAITSIFKDIDGVNQIINLPISSFAQDFRLNSSYTAINNGNFISTFLTDSQLDIGSQQFFYDANISGSHTISTIGTSVQSLQATLTNYRITGFNNPIVSQIFSTPLYEFITEPTSNYSTTGISYKSSITNGVFISGLFSPTINSEFEFDIFARNFINRFANFSSIGSGQLFYGTDPVGPVVNYRSSVNIKFGLADITTLPFPQNSILTLAQCQVPFTASIYQDPSDPKDIIIKAAATSAHPVSPNQRLDFNLGPSFYIDTVSDVSTFVNINSESGLRVISMLPRYDEPGTNNNMNDGIDANGLTSNGLNVSLSSYFVMGLSNTLTVSTSVLYNNDTSLSQVSFTNPFSRELLYTNKRFTHPAGYNFSIFSGVSLGNPGAIYPDFTYDLVSDTNFGNRYASFIYLAESNAIPTKYQFVNIRVKNPSALSTITDTRIDQNYAFPDAPIPDSNLQYSKVRMHMAIIGAHNVTRYSTIQTSWINCFKPVDYSIFDDSIYDVGGLVSVSTSGTDVYYKVQMNRRSYTSIYPIIRVGISRDGSVAELPANSDYEPISFEDINVSVSDS
jgi:hypothetical protein